MKNRRWFGLHHVSMFVLALCLFLVLGTVSIALSATNIDETDLTPSGTANEINLGPNGHLYISDATAQEIWRVSPANGAYTLYQNVGTVVDARPAGNEQIWWTDGATTFSTLAIGSGEKRTWSLSGSESLNGIAFDELGHVWMSEFFGSSAAIHRFNPATNQHCTYAVAGGLASNYIRYNQGFLWLVDWSAERIVRFNPTTLAVQSWSIEPAAGSFEWGFDLDQNGHFWWADLTASLSRLDPENNEQTRYDIPDVSDAASLMVNAGGNGVWYTDSGANTIGRLAPDQAAGQAISLDTITGSATESCETLDAGTISPFETDGGVFDWTAGTLAAAVDAAGWTVYELAEGAKPYGIAPGGDFLWITDNGRQKLLRLLPSDLPEENEQLFLPVLFSG